MSSLTQDLGRFVADLSLAANSGRRLRHRPHRHCRLFRRFDRRQPRSGDCAGRSRAGPQQRRGARFAHSLRRAAQPRDRGLGQRRCRACAGLRRRVARRPSERGPGAGDPRPRRSERIERRRNVDGLCGGLRSVGRIVDARARCRCIARAGIRRPCSDRSRRRRPAQNCAGSMPRKRRPRWRSPRRCRPAWWPISAP